jgi:hypothetical protein
MALSATLSLNQTPIGYNQNSGCQVTISNSGGSPVTVETVQLQILASGAPQYDTNINSQYSSLPQGFGQVFTSPAGGSVIVPCSFVIFSPQVVENGNLDQSVPTTYSVIANCYTSDGSSFSSPSQTLTITPISAN